MIEQQRIQRLEAISTDYSELPRRVLFVLGSGQSQAVDVFEEAAKQRFTTIEPQLLNELARGQRRSITISTPAQMIPEIVRSLATVNVAIYQVVLLEGDDEQPPVAADSMTAVD